MLDCVSIRERRAALGSFSVVSNVSTYGRSIADLRKTDGRALEALGTASAPDMCVLATSTTLTLIL